MRVNMVDVAKGTKVVLQKRMDSDDEDESSDVRSKHGELGRGPSEEDEDEPVGPWQEESHEDKEERQRGGGRPPLL